MGENYDKTMGRVRLQVRREYGESQAATLSVRAGWNDQCEMVENTLSIEELRDLRYMIDRALALQEAGDARIRYVYGSAPVNGAYGGGGGAPGPMTFPRDV